MSFIENFIPSVSRYVKNYYWLYLAGIVLPAVLTQLQLVKAGKVESASPIDFFIIAIPIIIQAISGTLAYIDQHKEES